MPSTQPHAAERRRARQREDARRAILDATEALLVEEGYERLSMRRLAARCGYATPTIYHYFGDKPRLIDALLEERFRTLLRQGRRVRTGPDPIDNLRSMMQAFLRFGLRHPTHYRLLTAPRPEELPLPPSAEEARELFEAPLRRLASEGRLEADPETAAQMVWALLHGLISLRTSRPRYPWSEHLEQRAVDALIRGIVAGDGESRA